MKKALLFTAAVIILVACKKDSISYKSEFDRSYETWLSYKSSQSNSYSYVVSSGSVLSNINTLTTLNIINGKVNSRNYIYNQYAPNSSTAIVTKSWTENATQLNTHANEGAEILTLDEVYSKAKSTWLSADKAINTIYFEAKNNGIISSCGYVPKNCADDCFTGINIQSIGSAL